VARCSLGPAQNFAMLILLGLRLCRPTFHPSACGGFAACWTKKMAHSPQGIP